MRMRKGCSFCMRNISAYIDGELSPSLTDEMKQHLAECSTCRAEHAFYIATMKTLASLRVPEPLRNLDAKILNRIGKNEHPLKIRKFIPAPLYAAAIGLFAGVFLAHSMVQENISMLESDRVIIQIMDVFSPSPQGSFSNAYFSIVNSTGGDRQVMQ